MASLVAAYTVAWVILMIYVVTLAARQRRLRAALTRLEAHASPVEPNPPAANAASPK